MEQQVANSRFLSIHLSGSIDIGHFDSCNDVYLKYSIVAGPDWVLASGSEIGVTQISRYKIGTGNQREFVWNQPVAVSYRSYNYFGWPQIVVSAYYFDTFGNDRILGYGSAYLPASSQTPANMKQTVSSYVPQSTSAARRILSWILGKKPELIESNLFARAECRSLLQLMAVGEIKMSFNLITKDISSNGYTS
jgi:B9 domain-containing protein 1